VAELEEESGDEAVGKVKGADVPWHAVELTAKRSAAAIRALFFKTKVS
jgi:hypothetical protein